MKNSTQKGFIVPLVIVVVLAAVIGAYVVLKNRSVIRDVAVPGQENASTTQVTIMVPVDLEAYRTAMANYVQTGGSNPLSSIQFVAKQVTPNTVSGDPIRDTAEAAAEYIQTQAGTSSIVRYFKVMNGTAYVVLDMDINGWAGVSVAIAQVHPIIEKSLLQFSQIKSVVFGPAPGDSLDSIRASITN